MMKVVQVYAETQEINLKVSFLRPCTWWKEYAQYRIFLSFCLQADSEVAQAGKAVALYFEDKLTDLLRQDPRTLPEFEQEEDDGEVTEDSDEDFIQPAEKTPKVR